jgi:HD-GYP domain-containing protein (c-di-GMP phosphodiesterase class II)
MAAMATNSLGKSQLYNSRLIDVYLKLLKKKYPQINANDILSYANIKPYEVADQGHWLTQDQVDRFYEKLVQATGNPHIAREAGRYAASPDALGIMRQYALGLMGPANAFKLIRQATSNLVKSAIYESEAIGPNEVQLTVTPRDGVEEKPFQCENRIGFFEAIVMMFNKMPPTITHTECVFKGGNSCVYRISWAKSRAQQLRNLRKLFLLFLGPAATVLYFTGRENLLTPAIPLVALLFLFLSLLIERHEKKDVFNSLKNIHDSSDQTINQIKTSYNNALLANEIGRAISRHTDLSKIKPPDQNNNEVDLLLNRVVATLQNRLDFDRGLILLASDDRSRLVFKAGYGYSTELRQKLQRTAFHLDKPNSRGIFVISFKLQKPFLINDIDDIQEDLSLRSFRFARELGVKSFICCPIIYDGESIGLLAVDNIHTKRPLIQSDMSLLMGIAPVIGVSIRNTQLLKAQKRQFDSILHVLAATIDARDPLTAGHSEKVTEYSLGICRELGMDTGFTEMVRVAALLHDYGKIAVPDSVLKKPGRLTDYEYELVKTHAAKSREILEQINFEGIYRDVPRIAGAHHEKMDGSGYPEGMTGEDIPLGARIIAVADFFEAITSQRHYRDPMPLDIACQQLLQHQDQSFDGRVIEAFFAFIKQQYGIQPENLPARSVTLERDAARVPYHTEVILLQDGRKTTATSANISKGGIYIASEYEFPEGCAIQIAFVSPAQPHQTVSLKGRVAWTNRPNFRRKAALPIGFGVEFLDPPHIFTESVFNFVKNCLEDPQYQQSVAF